MSLKQPRSHRRSSGSTDHEAASANTQSVSQASGQRAYEDESRTQVAQRKKVSATVFVDTCIATVEAVETLALCELYSGRILEVKKLLVITAEHFLQVNLTCWCKPGFGFCIYRKNVSF